MKRIQAKTNIPKENKFIPLNTPFYSRLKKFSLAIIMCISSLSVTASNFEKGTIQQTPLLKIDNVQTNIDWQACTGYPEPYQCANVEVPLSYNPKDKASQQTINIAIARYPAADQKNKMGSIFLNPGGPGGSGVQFLLSAGPILFSEEVRQNFDLIGFDPRGIGLSNPLQCFKTQDEQDKAFDAEDIPVLFPEILKRKKADKLFVKFCNKNGDRILKNMSTADVARDLDILRQAVGDSKLNYVGYSYGSYLGTTYANMFPDNIRSLIVDGVLDPIAWATGRHGEKYYVPVTTRLKSDVGARDTLNEFFRLCDNNPQNCAFGGDSAQRFDAIYESLKKSPIEVTLDNGEVILVTSTLFINFTLQSMYSSDIWPSFAETLFILEQLQSPEDVAYQLKKLYRELGIEDQLYFDSISQSSEGFISVLCSDSNSPRDYFAWPLAAEYSNYAHGYFGASWTWSSSQCKFWKPAKNRYAGPFNQTTNHPILVTSTLFDPATPYHGAEIVSKLMPNSRLVTVEGWGHTTPFISQCADAITANYLLTGILPDEKNTVCQANITPFEYSSAQSIVNVDENIKKRQKLIQELNKSKSIK